MILLIWLTSIYICQAASSSFNFQLSGLAPNCPMHACMSPWSKHDKLRLISTQCFPNLQHLPFPFLRSCTCMTCTLDPVNISELRSSRYILHFQTVLCMTIDLLFFFLHTILHFFISSWVWTPYISLWSNYKFLINVDILHVDRKY